MASGKTFRIGSYKINFSKRGIAAKKIDGDQVWRLPFPWANKQSRPEKRVYDGDGYSGGDQYDDYEAGDETWYNTMWFNWLMLVVLPPVGIWLAWRNNRYEITMRSAISAASCIWFIIMIVWIVSGVNSGGSDMRTTGDQYSYGTYTPAPSLAAQASDGPGVSATIAPVSTQQGGIPTYPTSTPPPTFLAGDSTLPPDGTTATPAPLERVWCTDTGKYYHSYATCSGMVGAAQMLKTTAQAAGKPACPYCWTNSGQPTTRPAGTNTQTTPTYYATKNGTYYHSDQNCSGMRGATKITAANAVKQGKSACTKCVTKVFATKNGTYYHANATCSGMQDASSISVTQAKNDGKKACPTCIGKASAATNNTNTNNNTATTTYYATDNGKYYHVKATCSGMRDAKKVTLATAKGRDQTACPVCIGNQPTTTTYYATSEGTYYHVKATCSGMRNAVKVTLTQAKNHGQAACPVCITGTGTGGTSGSTSASYYSTKNGKYYHKTATCSGMRDADKVTLNEAQKRNQVACPKCLGTVASYYATKDGKYYHKTATCSGMRNATKVSVVKATQNGQTACPVCLKGTAATPKPTTDPDAKYYGTPNGKYYHVKARCSGMQNAQRITLAQAKGKDQTACPVCIGGDGGGTSPSGTPKPSDNSKIKVWVTIEGSKYHSKQYCSGMRNAASTTLTWALEHNYSRCSTCDAPRSVE